MHFFGPDEVAQRLPWVALVESIEAILLDSNAVAPERTVHSIEVLNNDDASLLLKPAWVVGDVVAVKVVTFFPNNGTLGLSTVNAGVLLFDAKNGTMLGACDGNELTTRRTAAASAVAAKRLVRPDAQNLLIVGTGALSPMAIAAHSSVHTYRTVEVWGRSGNKASDVVASLGSSEQEITRCDDLDEGVSRADVICCVTGATEPLVKGALLKPGAHVDLIGSFTPQMRESDDDVMRRGSVWVDTKTDGILAGDLAQPLASGVLSEGDLKGDLRDLVAGPPSARQSADEITVFKSAGIALEDVAAARLVFG